MTTHNESHAGDALFEAFVEQVKQVLEHLYDFAYLQQHSLARIYDHAGDLSAKTAGRQLRADVIRVIESLKPPSEATFRAPVARLYNMLHLYYVENLSIQDAALELGLSERQAYRDLKRGQESIAAALWDKRLPESQPKQVNITPLTPQDFSFETEIARLKLNFSMVDIRQLFHSAQDSVKRLSQQRSVEITAEEVAHPLMISTDAGVAQQILVSILSSAIQQAESGPLKVSFRSMHRSAVTLTLHYAPSEDVSASLSPVIATLVHRLRWNIAQEDLTAQTRQVVLEMTSSKATILVIDDNEGWTELLGRFLEGADCVVIAGSAVQDVAQQVHDLQPTLIILDVMMPGRDGWELLQRLRAQPSTSDIPIMVCTVFHDSQLAYSLGASAFVSKPAGREIILETLEMLGIL